LDHYRQYTRLEQTAEECPSLGEVTDNRSAVNKYYSYHLIFLLILILSLSLTNDIFSQRKADIGIFAGTSWYQGDINPSLPFYSADFAAGLIYRYNFHARTSVRVSGIWHNLSANDLDFMNDIQQARAASFNSEFIDMAVSWEFNFLPYRTAFRKTKHSPYVSAGIGYNLVLSSDAGSNSHLTIPFGLGYKFNVTNRMSAGLECTFRKTFTDNIDGLENYSLNDDYLLLGNKDWYTFAGIFITYKIFKFREDCPVYD
jgi:hypothetical protein